MVRNNDDLNNELLLGIQKTLHEILQIQEKTNIKFDEKVKEIEKQIEDVGATLEKYSDSIKRLNNQMNQFNASITELEKQAFKVQEIDKSVSSLLQKIEKL